MAKRSKSLADQIRRAVDESGLSQYAICKMIDVDKAQMSRFMSGERFLSEASLNRLATALNLRIASGVKSKEGDE
jgi:transcriptional regulator with XRE-family HTH domain